MKSGILGLVTIAAVIGIAGTTGQAQAATAGDKLKRGAANFFFSIVEVPRTIAKVKREDGLIAAITWGPPKALGNGLARKAAGLHDLATWPIPLPKNYEPIMQPEYPWSTPPSGS